MALELSGGFAPPDPKAQIVVWCGPESDDALVAGLSLARRAVLAAWRAGFGEIRIVTEGDIESLALELRSDARFADRNWGVDRPGDDWLGAVESSGGRWVVLPADWIVDSEHLRTLAASEGDPAGAEPPGPFAAGAADLASWARDGWNPGEPPPDGRWASVERPPMYVRARSDAERRDAEESLYRSLARKESNAFARHVDRVLSRAITRRLARFPITPNQITLASIGIGIFGALVLLHPSYLAGVIGAFLFLASTVIDGCDGEIARLKYLESPSGAKLDLIGDNVVHAVLFPCLALRYHFADPNGPFLWLGSLAVGGVIASWIGVYLTILRKPPTPKVRAVFETFANREFAYLLFALGLVGKLHWFVWAMAVGLWAFPAVLGVLALSESVSRPSSG